MEISNKDSRDNMHAMSPPLTSIKGGSSFLTSVQRKKHMDLSNKYILCEPFEGNTAQRRRQRKPGNSTPGAPSLVPTCSEVCMGSNVWEATHSRRISTLMSRIEMALDGMEKLLRRRPKEPDGDEELERRQTRSVEFISRFSRNYLFQLRIQVMELKRQIQRNSLASPGKYLQHEHEPILKKLVASHQTAVQGLQACLNQLPGSSYDPAILSKLDQLLCYICELTTLKSQIDVNNFSTASDHSPRQDNIKTKAEKIIEIVRRKKKEREEAHLAWRETVGILARKRFGYPPMARAKILRRHATLHEKRLPRKPERQERRQRTEKQLGLSLTRTIVQEEGCEVPPNQLNDLDLPESKLTMQADVPLDPATALELRTIMSRMKDILRGTHIKPAPPPKPMYPPNVGLIFITHEEDSMKSDEPKEKTEKDDNMTVKILGDPANNTKELLPTEQDSQKTLKPKVPSDSAGLPYVEQIKIDLHERATERDAPEQPSGVDIVNFDKRCLESSDDDALTNTDNLRIISKKEETNCSERSTRLRRRLTPEEQRIIKYRNRFKCYKERVREIQNTSEQLLSAVFREVARELEPSILLDKMYHLELQG